MAGVSNAGPMTGILHKYAPSRTVFEYTSPSNAQVKKPHSLIFVGGLGDGYRTVPMVHDFAAALEPTPWSIFQAYLSSSYNQWGLSSLSKDVEDIAKCVEYVRGYKAAQDDGGKVVIMGHSTGSQDVLHYLHSANPLPSNPDVDAGLEFLTRPPVDGAILQSPVSDREGLLSMAKTDASIQDTVNHLVDSARKQTYTDDKQDVLLPLSLTTRLYEGTPVTARRLLSLVSPDSPERPAEDDLFSSDLTDARLDETFGVIRGRGLLKQTLLVVPGGSDQYVPEWVDKEKLLARWKAAANRGAGEKQVWNQLSGIIPGARHSPGGDSQAQPRAELTSRVTTYLESLEG